MQLITANRQRRSRNLVFTSAGDRSNVSHWLDGRRDFDLWVVYYGATADGLRQCADLYLSRKGSKFQNLHFCYGQWPEVLAGYEAIMVMDDDIVIDASGITRMFEIRRQFDLWAAQPAFRLSGKISWDITRVHPTAKLRYTNYIEMACPLFRTDKLTEFLQVYDPALVGYGTDWWFLHSMGPVLQDRVAVVDEVTCVNPFDRDKGGEREIDRLQSHDERKKVWERMKAEHGLDEQGRMQVEYRRIKRTWAGTLGSAARNLPDWSCYRAKMLARRLLKRGPVKANTAS